MIDLRCGRWQDVLSDIECDALICDPPYSARTQSGYRTATDFTLAAERERRARAAKDSRSAAIRSERGRASHSNMPRGRFELGYLPITECDAQQLISAWVGRTKNWIVLFGDHVSNRWWLDALDSAGWVTFAPVPWLRRDAPPRFAGDGPANNCEWIAIGRPRKVTRCGSLPGWYDVGSQCEKVVTGGKPLELMRALVRDYSRPGDLICDPCAGGATTLLAAAMEGRRAVGAEMDPVTYAKAQKRIAKGYTPPLFVEERSAPEQIELEASAE